MQLPGKPVGPLPSAIYWRRRAVLLAVVLLPIFLLATCAFTGGDDSGTDSSSSTGSHGRKQTQQNVPKVQDGSKEHPFYPVPGPAPEEQAQSAEQAAAVQPPAAPPPAAPDPNCSDAEVQVQVEPEHRNYPVGSRLKIKLVITNTSSRECQRDVGSGQQEISAAAGANKIWSSDHCAGSAASDQRTLKAGERLEFWAVWTGVTSTDGCGGGDNVPPGDYQIAGRVGTANSQPATVTLK